jgi:hypothetical protein
VSRIEPTAAPARYFPVRRGAYDVAPALRPLGADFGNGSADGLVFQVDRRFRRFRRNKLRCRAECLDRYVATADYSPALAAAVARFIAARLAAEHPDYFRFEGGPRPVFHSALTGDTLRFDADMRLRGGGRTDPAYADAWDALACQVQEDLAVTAVDSAGADRLAALHVCAPSHWAPAEKIGRSFVQVHQPVPGMAALFPAADALVGATISKGPWVRFVWGVSGDCRLNHHPAVGGGVPAFRARARPPGYFRVERQVLWGLPDVGASLFVIAPSYVALPDLTPAERTALAAALRGMAPDSRAYKGLADCWEALAAWLTAPG